MMSKMRFVLPLILVLPTCWADLSGDPILENIDPQPIEDIPGNYILPKNVVPKKYHITLEPFIDIPDAGKNFTFEGNVVIDLDVKRRTNTITLHAKELNIREYRVQHAIGKDTIVIKVNDIKGPDPQTDFLILYLESPLAPLHKNPQLIMEYTGTLNDKLHGFYRSSYLTTDNKTRWLATTQFEPTGARQAFPCWDEPGVKAQFNIVIKHDKRFHALSNTPIKDSKEEKDQIVSSFVETPVMSTYLVAFVISDFEKYMKNDTKFNVWTKPHSINSAKHAYDYGQLVLKELDTWTGIPYYKKIGKLDQISIPNFKAGAMENWGLVTYRESALLYTEGKTTTKEKQDIIVVIAHEFAHQWFGNLVTPAWWDYIWLNEGFATFFQHYIVDKVLLANNNETWRLMEQFVVNNVQVSSFGIDSTTKTRPMNANPSVKTTSQISSLFDNIAYKKAASVIRMMHHFLSDAVFQEGIKDYLNRFQVPELSVVTDRYLFDSLQRVARMKNVLPSNLSVNKIMDNWVNKAGYPVITATKNNKSEIELKQERFFLTKPLKQDNTQWYIPIDYLKQDSEQFSKIEWMEPEQPKTLTKMDAKENNKWILINKDQAGYYRVNYDKNNWKLLTEYLKSTEIQNSSINATNRAQLIDDALNLARAGDLDYTTSMGITLYLTKEDDYIPWIAAVRAFDYLDTLLQGTEKYALFKNYVAQRVKSFADKFDIENFASNNTHVDKLAKVLALNAACKYGVEKCEKFAEKEIKEWLEEKKDGKEEKKLLIDYRSTLLCAGLRKADEQTWNKTLEKYETTADKDEQNEILAGLGCVTNEKIVNTFLESTLEKDSGISVFDAMNSVARGNPASFNLLIGFINTNLKTIRGEENKNRELLLNHLDLLARKVITHEQYTELSLLVHVHLEEHEVFEGFSHAMDNIAWIKHHQQTVSKWIEENQDDSNQDNKKDPNSASSFVLSSFLIMIPLLLTRL